MNDRLVFTHSTLKNGAAVYTRTMDCPSTKVIVSVPVGTAHCGIGTVLPGAAHFLEHLMCERSLKNPVRRQFTRKVGMTGGDINATTSLLRTTYEMSVPNRHLEVLLPDLCSAVFEPLLLEKDIGLERGIISNERFSKKRWAPSSDEIGQYMCTRDEAVSLDRGLGSDMDLEAISAEHLNALHKHYFDPRVQVVAVGPVGIEPLVNYIEGLDLGAAPLPAEFTPLQWVNKEYRVEEFWDTSQYTLILASLFPSDLAPREVQGINFILTYLLNSVHGPLDDWLRHEKGWLYGNSFHVSPSAHGGEWGMELNLNTLSQVDSVRQEIWVRMERGLRDQKRVSEEIARVRDEMAAYSFQTPSDILSTAEGSLENFGRIITETEYDDNLNHYQGAEYRMNLFRRFFNPEEVGSFCAVPRS
jgi:predicted Zn-dependent peptidase